MGENDDILNIALEDKYRYVYCFDLNLQLIVSILSK